MSAIDSLPSLPYAQQLRIIRDCISSRSQLAPMLGILAGLPDHEPLSQAFCQLAEAGLLDEVAPTLAHLFVSLPDTGIGRVLRGLGEAAINPRQHAHLVDALSAAVRSLPVERIAALCLMDRWLKNSAPESRAALIDEAFKQAEDALVRRAPVPHNVLLRIPGSRLATLDAVAQALSAQEAWSNTTAAFARQVLDLLQALPRSLSQANAEELLAKRVYTDPGHFLVELLQNAEDAAATHCIIAIDSDAVRVWHNGVPFDAKDVVGVLSIGQTTKAREQIGFFGVGFKSVYEISERPRIDSGLFCFEIADVSIPRRLHPEPRPPHLPEGGTLLTLPYRPNLDTRRSPEQLYHTATAIPAETLLTLSNLRTLTVRQADTFRTVHRASASSEGTPHVRLELSSEVGPSSPLHYLTCAEDFDYLEGARELNKARRTRVLVALPLDPRGDSPRPLPPDAPTLFSHLPTRERSGLRFLVHAHFDLPVDRERLDLESPWNHWALRCAGTLLAKLLRALLEAGDTRSLDAALDLLPLPRELTHAAFHILADQLREATRDLPWLPGADGERLTVEAGLLLDDPALLPILRGVSLDPQARRALAPTNPRSGELMQSLGAKTFEAHDLVALLEAHDTAPAWLTAQPLTFLEVLGDSERYGHLDERLARLPLLPDALGALHSSEAIVRLDPELRPLYGPARTSLAPTLDEHASPRQEALLRRLHVRHHGIQELLVDLCDAGRARTLLDHAGASPLHLTLSRFPTPLLAPLTSQPLFPTRSGDWRALEGPTAAWLGGADDLERFVASLTHPPVALLEPSFADTLRPYLQRLGAQQLDLDRLLDLFLRDPFELAPKELTAFHTLLAARAPRLSDSQLERLRQLPLFNTSHGDLRPLRGPTRALLPEHEALVELAPALPWLSPTLRTMPHLQRLSGHAFGGTEVVRAMLLESEVQDLVDPFDSASIERAYAYLLQHPPELAPSLLERLVEAPVWLDSRGSLHVLSALRSPPTTAPLSALYQAWGAHPTVDADNSHGSLALCRRLSLTSHLIRLDTSQLAHDLAQSPDASALLEGPLRPLFVEALNSGAAQLSADARDALSDASIFRDEEGVPRPLGRWNLAEAERVVRAAGPLRELLLASGRPILSEDDDTTFGPLLDALGAPPAGLETLVTLIEGGTLSTTEQLERARALFVSFRAALGADAETLSRARLSALPLWPGSTGRDELGASLERVRPTDLSRVVGADWPALILSADILAPEAEADAKLLSPFFEFGSPLELIASSVETAAQHGLPVAEQTPALRDPERLLRLFALLHQSLEPGRADALPLAINARRELVRGRLFWATICDVALARGTELEAQLVEPNWGVQARGRVPDAFETLPARRLLEHILEESREPQRAEEHPRWREPEAREQLYAWLIERQDELGQDPTALGRLGAAHLFLTRGGRLQRPEALLVSARDGQIAESLSLLDRSPHPEIPAAVLDFLDRCYELARKGLSTLVNALSDGHRAAQSERDGERSVAILQALERALDEASGGPEEKAELVKRFKLSKLKLEAHTGEFREPRKLLIADPYQVALLGRFLGESEAQLHPRYAEAGLLPLVTLLGAQPSLSTDALEAWLGSGQRTPDAALAGACYVLYTLPSNPSWVGQLRLNSRAWVPDGAGERVAPPALYWPSAQVRALVGAERTLYPHPELVLHAHAGAATRVAFKGEPDVVFEEVLAHVLEVGLDAEVLSWLERRLRAGNLDRKAIFEGLGNATLFAADDGTLRAPFELTCDGDAPLYFGRLRAVWSDGLRFSKLASTLKIPQHVDAEFTRRFVLELAVRLATQDLTLEALPELARGLPRCLALLAREQAEPVASLPVIATVLASQELALVAASAPDVALPLPMALAEAARKALAPVKLVLVTEDVDGSVSRWMRSCGAHDLEALTDLDPLAARLPLDLSGSESEALETLRDRLVQTTAALVELAEHPLDAPKAFDLALVERLERSGKLAGTEVHYLADLALERWKNGRLRVVLTPLSLDARALLAAHLLAALGVHPDEREPLLETAIALLRAADLKSFAGEKQQHAQSRQREVARRQPPKPSASEAVAEERPGLWSQLKNWWRADDAPKPTESPSSEPKKSPKQEQKEEARPFHDEHGAQREWFRGKDDIGAQLHDATQWLEGRYRRPDFGYAFSPATLPLPWRYAPHTVASQFDRRAQRWLRLEFPEQWSAPDDVARGEVMFEGRLPRGEAILPVPMYGRVEGLELPPGARSLQTLDGRLMLMLAEDSVVRGRFVLGAPPELLDEELDEALVPEALLVATAADSELPDEVHALLESLESSSPRERCWAIRDFIRERYRYDPTYLEDPAVAGWLKNVSRGRDNVHLAALHAGRDARHLGRGVCYELNVLACEMMRRSGVPAAIASGWTLDRGQADAPDHLWAVGLLATVAGPRWMPVDASTTRDGRPLHVAERPTGPWRVRASKKTEPAASPTPDWVPPARIGRGSGMQGAAEQRGFRVQSPSRGAAPERARREPERPLREMIRVLRYLDRKTGAPLSDEERMRRAQLLLQKPQELRERLFDEPDE